MISQLNFSLQKLHFPENHLIIALEHFLPTASPHHNPMNLSARCLGPIYWITLPGYYIEVCKLWCTFILVCNPLWYYLGAIWGCCWDDWHLWLPSYLPGSQGQCLACVWLHNVIILITTFHANKWLEIGRNTKRYGIGWEVVVVFQCCDFHHQGLTTTNICSQRCVCSDDY